VEARDAVQLVWSFATNRVMVRVSVLEGYEFYDPALGSAAGHAVRPTHN
jgi:hypothetical protein